MYEGRINNVRYCFNYSNALVFKVIAYLEERLNGLTPPFDDIVVSVDTSSRALLVNRQLNVRLASDIPNETILRGVLDTLLETHLK